MDQKMQFIADYLRQTLSIIELCERYGVSRKTRYKWIARALKQGPLGLEERSRQPHSSPRQTPRHVVDAFIALLRHHPAWGTKKLLFILQQRHPRWPLPARSTVCEILRRSGHLACLLRPAQTRPAARTTQAHRRCRWETHTTAVTVTHGSGPFCYRSPRPVTSVFLIDRASHWQCDSD